MLSNEFICFNSSCSQENSYNILDVKNTTVENIPNYFKMQWKCSTFFVTLILLGIICDVYVLHDMTMNINKVSLFFY
jgi:hypothetical protein